MMILPKGKEGMHHRGIARSSWGVDIFLVKASFSLGSVMTALAWNLSRLS